MTPRDYEVTPSLRYDQTTHSPLDVRDSVSVRSADNARTKAGMPYTQCGAEHPLSRVANARRAVFWLRSEDRRICQSGVRWCDIAAEGG